MEIDIKNIAKNMLSSKNRIKVIVLIGMLGIMLIMLSEIKPNISIHESNNPSISYDEYVDNLEKRTESIISSINGVGRCKVMITISSSNESVYAKNSEEKTDSGSYSKKYEYVLYDGADGDEPILETQYFPNVQGIVVVCSGGDNVAVKECIINALSSLYDVPSSKISVSKIEG